MTNPEPPPPGELAAVRAREPEALARFFERHFDSIYALVYRLLGERAAAEDVTQEVFYKVYRAAHTLDPERDPRPWLRSIAYNACRDVWRSGAYRLSRRSRSLEGEPGLGDRLTSGLGEPEKDALRAERERLVQAALLELPENLRVPIVLHDYEDLSHAEIATMLGVHHAAARKRYSRALAALGARLKEMLG